MMNAKLCYELKFIFTVFSVSFVDYFAGCSFVFSSILFAQLREPESSIKLTAEESSWIASVSPLVSPIGLLIVGVLTDKIGRRKTLQVSYIWIILGWLILMYANSYEYILIGRIVMGLTFGAGACIYVYAAEICIAARRQAFFSVLFVFVGLGMLTTCAFAMFFTWRTVSAIFAAMSAVGLASLAVLPESPAWLLSRERVSEAERAARWFGLDAAKMPGADGSAGGSDGGRDVAEPPRTGGGGGGWSMYAQRTVWKPTLITVAFLGFQQCTGLYVMFFYSADVLLDFGVRWDGIVVSVFLSVARIVGSVAFLLMHQVNRKTLAVVSFAGMAASLCTIIAYMKIWAGQSGDVIPVLAFVAYMFFALFGALPLPWTLCSEVFPRDVTGTMNGVVQTCAAIMMFAVIKMYPSMVYQFGINGVWLIFTVISVASVFFSAFVLPETKGVPLEDILDSFKSRKKVTNGGTVS